MELDRIKAKRAMATRWRRRRMCVLVAAEPCPAVIRSISARTAFLETNARPTLGSAVELRHPEAGRITGRVTAIAEDGVALAFSLGAESTAFALAAIAADMSRPS